MSLLEVGELPEASSVESPTGECSDLHETEVVVMDVAPGVC